MEIIVAIRCLAPNDLLSISTRASYIWKNRNDFCNFFFLLALKTLKRNIERIFITVSLFFMLNDFSWQTAG